MKFLLRNPFFRLLLPLVAGIVVNEYFIPSGALFVSISFISLFFIFLSFVLRKPQIQYRFRWLFGAGIFLLVFSLGYFLSNQREMEGRFSHLNQKQLFVVELISASVEKAKTTKCEVKLLSVLNGNKESPAQGKAMLFVQKDSLSKQLLLGDRLLIRAEFKSPPGSVNPDGFNYALYLKRKGILATAYVNTFEWTKLHEPTRFSIFRLANEFRGKLLNIYRAFGIAGDEFAVLAALTLGFTDELQPELLAGYSATGAMHILSVSGLHVGIVYVVIAFLLGFMSKSHQLKVWRAIIIVLFLWMYAFLTGLSPSVIRSALMFSLVAVGGALERRSQIYNTIFVSAFFMLLINPDYLFDVGFQLSYSAVLSIVFFQRTIAGFVVVQNKLLRWVRDLFAVSIAAQLGTLPVTLYYFQQFPNYFLLTNLVAIPLSTVVIYLSVLLLFISGVPYLSLAVAFLLKWSVWLLNYLIVRIEHLPFSVSVLSFDFIQMCLFFIALAGISIYFYSKRFMFLFTGLFSLLMVIGIAVYVKWDTLNSQKLVLYSSKNMQLNYIANGQNYVLVGDTAEISKIAGAFWKRHFIQKPEFVYKNDWFNGEFGCVQGKTFLIVTDKWWKGKTPGEVLFVDYLFVGNKSKPKIKQLFENIRPGKIILDSSISDWYTESIRQECLLNDIPFYSVAEKGAYVLNFTD